MYLAAGSAFAGGQTDPDALYRQRADLDQARAAVAIWDQRLRRDGRDFEAAWKRARARYWIGTHVPDDEREDVLEQGMRSAEHAIRLMPDRPEGHFWLAATMGALAESGGIMSGLRYRGRIKDELVPGLFGGSNAEAEKHLRQSLTYNPNSTSSLVFLAEVLVDEGRTADAIEVLKRAIAAPVDPEWAPEDAEFKAQARRMLDEISERRHRW